MSMNQHLVVGSSHATSALRSSAFRKKHKASCTTVLILATAGITGALSARSVHAATYVYDPLLNTTGGSDGPGVWDTTTPNWYSGGLKPWSNLSTDVALFGNSSTGIAGTVVVSTVNAGTIQFNAVSGSYVLTGGTINLSSPSTINLSSTATLLTPTINSVIAGSSGLLLTGNNLQANATTSTLTLGGANTYSGVTNVSGGLTLSVSSLPTGSSTSSNLGNTSGLILQGTTGAQNTAGNFNAGSELLYTGSSQSTPMSFTFSSTAAIQNIINVNSSSTTLTVTGQATSVPNGTNTFRFYKQGPGTLVFAYNGLNSFNNNAFLLVDNGVLQFGTAGNNSQVNTIANGLVVGNQLAYLGSTPTFVQVSGTTNIAGSLAFSNGDTNSGQNLYANLSAGTMNVTSIQAIVNGTNNSILNLSGTAVLADTGNLQGVSTAGASSLINLSGTAVFNNSGTAISYLVGGGGGTGTINQSGGLAIFNAGLQINGTGTAIEIGTYNLSGGTLDTLTLSGNSTNASSVAVVNFNAGTLQAFGNNTAFVTGVTANVLAGGAVIDSQAFTVTVASPLLASATSAGGGLTKVGSGTLILTGASTYTGTTNISNGTLQLGNDVATSGTLASTSPIFGAGGLTYAQAPLSTTITPNPLNSYTGATNIAGGSTVSVSNIPNGGAVSALGASSNASGNLIINGNAGNGNAIGGGAILLFTGTGLDATDRGITLQGNVQNNINVSNAGATLSFGGQVVLASPAGRFYKLGPGTLAFTAPNVTNNLTAGGSYLNIGAGILQLGAAGQINIAGADFRVGSPLTGAGDNPTLNLVGGVTSVGNTSIGGVVSGYNAPFLNGLGLGFGVPTTSGAVTATANLTNNAVFNGLAVYSGDGSNNITAALNMSGSSVINDSGVLEGDMSGTGDTFTINLSGSAVFNGSSALSSLAYGTGIGAVNQTGGIASFPGLFIVGGGGIGAVSTGTYNLGGGSAGSGLLSVGGIGIGVTSTSSTAVINFNGGTLQASGSNPTFVTSLSSANVLNGGATIDTQGFSVGIAQPLLHGGSATPDGGLTKIGSGTLTLSGSNTYTGGTQLTAGTLVVTNPSALGTGTATLSNATKLSLSLNAYSGFSGYTTNNNGNFSPVISSSGMMVTLTNTTQSNATSVFSPNLVSVNDLAGFSASFIYSHATIGTVGGPADGITFTFQNQSNGALGGSGGQLAYALGTGTNTTGAAITPSVAVVVDEFHDEIGTGQNGVLNEGTPNSTPGISNQSTSFVTVVYSGITQTLTETVTDAQGVYTTSLTNFDLAAQLGETGSPVAVGYIGFTGSTGGNSDTQTVSNFLFNTSSGVTITNTVTVAAGASSIIQLSPTMNYSSGGVGAITVSSGATLTVANNGSGGASRGVLVTPSVTFINASSGTFDVGVNALDITNQTLSTVTGMVATAYKAGTWTGPGITSTAAASDTTHLTALGVISNNVAGSSLYGSGATLGLFDGANPALNDVLVKYTYYGDTDLSGVVDGTDYSRIDAAFQSEHFSNGVTTTPVSGWFNGDFNYDGVVNGSDYTLMDNAFNSQGTNLAASVASPTALVGAGGSAVPEPATFSLLGIGAISLLSRRRQK